MSEKLHHRVKHEIVGIFIGGVQICIGKNVFFIPWRSLDDDDVDVWVDERGEEVEKTRLYYCKLEGRWGNCPRVHGTEQIFIFSNVGVPPRFDWFLDKRNPFALELVLEIFQQGRLPDANIPGHTQHSFGRQV